MATRIIGIDLGTSTTVVRVHNVGAGNRIVPVTVNGQRTIPTIVFKPTGSDEIYYGYDAKAKMDSGTDGAFYENFKMDLISNEVEKRNQAEVCIQGFLKYVYDQYLRLLNDGIFDAADEVKVYVSHPAKWNSYARTLMKQSVEKAGFCGQENVALKDEPTAAVLAVIHEKNAELRQAGMLHVGRKYKAMVIDMGAGTTDVVLCTYKVTDGKLQIDDIFTYPSINAPGLCGGREIDHAIISAAERFVNDMQIKPSPVGEKVISQLRRRVKKWKELTVSGILEDGAVLPEPDEIAEFRDTLSTYGVPVRHEEERFSISREYFETFTKSHWEQWVGLLNGAFSEVKGAQYKNLDCPKAPEEVELLIVTGGHSQWYIVSEYLLGKNSLSIELPSMNFEKIRERPECMIQSADPQETVAVGLCHLDEDVVGTIAASNDVSISFSCEGSFLGTCDLIEKGVPLPFEKKDTLEGTINGLFIYHGRWNVEYSVITDNKNVVVKSQIVPSTGVIITILKSILALLGVAIFDIPKILWYFIRGRYDELSDTLADEIVNYSYKVKLWPKISVNEEGIIKIGCTISVEDVDPITIPEIVI